MFSYQLPGGLNTKTYKTPEGQIKFDPPVYEQRYSTAIRIVEDSIWKEPIKKVLRICFDLISTCYRVIFFFVKFLLGSRFRLC